MVKYYIIHVVESTGNDYFVIKKGKNLIDKIFSFFFSAIEDDDYFQWSHNGSIMWTFKAIAKHYNNFNDAKFDLLKIYKKEYPETVKIKEEVVFEMY